MEVALAGMRVGIGMETVGPVEERDEKNEAGDRMFEGRAGKVACRFTILVPSQNVCPESNPIERVDFR